MFGDIPYEDGFEKTIEPMILPFSIDEAWELFFSDDAPYFVSEPFKALGHDLKSVSKWGSLQDEKFKETVD